jgi:hypothetical protein
VADDGEAVEGRRVERLETDMSGATQDEPTAPSRAAIVVRT